MFNSGPKNLLFEKPSAASLAAAPLLDHWEIPANEVIMDSLLWEGAFSEVYKGIIKCPIVNPKVRPSAKSSICTPVAIKLLKRECQPVCMVTRYYVPTEYLCCPKATDVSSMYYCAT